MKKTATRLNRDKAEWWHTHLKIHSTYIGYCQVKFATQKDNDKNKREEKNAVRALTWEGYFWISACKAYNKNILLLSLPWKQCRGVNGNVI